MIKSRRSTRKNPVLGHSGSAFRNFAEFNYFYLFRTFRMYI